MLVAPADAYKGGAAADFRNHIPRRPTVMPGIPGRMGALRAFASLALWFTFAPFWTSTPLFALQGMASGRITRPGVQVNTDKTPIQVHFEDIAESAGLTAVNVFGGTDTKKYIVETTGNGAAVFDFDNDGLMDLFLPNGGTLEDRGAGKSHLYRNLGSLKFEDVTGKAGVEKPGWAQGACVGDYDNDGHRDLFVTYWGQSTLFHNNGDGSFSDVTEKLGLKSGAERWDTGCTFFDYDLDGKLDLAVTGYVDFDLKTVPHPGSGDLCRWKGMAVMCGPRGLPPGRNFLFHNTGGVFADVSQKSGIAAPTGCYGFTALASDFDNDGYPDLYVACDSTASLLYINRKNGTFEESGIFAGVALNEDGQEQAGMGIAVADYDQDGLFDLIKTNFSDDTPNLYHNNGDGTFTDSVYRSGLGAHTQSLGWGVHFLDVDNDGLKDVLIVNGHVYPEVDRANLGASYRQGRLFYWNIGGGRFVSLTENAGPAITAAHSSRGSAQADFDNDGSIEVVIVNMGERPSLLHNSAPRQNWLLVALEGVAANRDAIGARVSVHVGDMRLAGEVEGGSGFLSQNDPRLHFGLGDRKRYDRIEVLWPGGAKETFEGGEVNRIVRLKQGAGKAATTSKED